MGIDKLDRFRELLGARREEMVREILRRRDHMRVERSPDLTDELQQAGDCELAAFQAETQCGRLRQIEAALRRIEDGSFGKCLHCDRHIGRERLAAVPWASLCIRCQEAADRGDAAHAA